MAVERKKSVFQKRNTNKKEPFIYNIMFRLLRSHHLRAAATLTGVGLLQGSDATETCGIVGIVSKRSVNEIGSKEKDDSRSFLLEGLQILRNRGYDSAGIATLASNGEIKVIYVLLPLL